MRNGHRVRAIARDGEAAQARVLAGLGAEVATADGDDVPSMERAAVGVDTLFVMGTPVEGGVEGETRRGINIINAAKTAGVKHIVYSSVAGADQKTGIPHFESKYLVERHLRSVGVPFTIVAPVYFMENLVAPWNTAALASGVYALALPAERRLQQIAVADIARFTAEVIARPDEFSGVRIDIASDELTGAEAAAIVTRTSGRKVSYVEVPLEQVRAASEDLAIMFEWLNRVGYHADIVRLRASYPGVGWHTFESWASTLPSGRAVGSAPLQL
jgi:uncharacterized protein YbjT (DUF2867 family)